MRTRSLPLADTPPTVISDVEALFRAFADPTRIRVLNVLAAGELCVCDVVEILDLPQPTISKHLGYLRRSGLVEVAREWKYAHYRLAKPRTGVHRTLLSCVRSCFEGVTSLDRERELAVARVRARLEDPCD